MVENSQGKKVRVGAKEVVMTTTETKVATPRKAKGSQKLCKTIPAQFR